MSAKAESFRRVPETCPTVDALLAKVEQSIKDALWHVDKREQRDIYDDLQTALYRLEAANAGIKSKCTEVLRAEFIEAIEERDEAQSELEELKSDPRPRRDWTDEEIRSASNA